MSQGPKKDQVIDILVEKTSHTREEIEAMIQETIELMDNMVNEDGAAYVVANNLSVPITLEQPVQLLQISEIIAGQSNVSLEARINRIYQTRVFQRKDGTSGKVKNLEIIDDTGSTRLALWDSRVDVIEEQKLQVGDVIRVTGASTKLGYQQTVELSVGVQGFVEKVADPQEDQFPEVQQALEVEIASIEEMDDNTEVSIKGKIVERRPVNTFSRKDGSEGKVGSFTVQDATGKTRVTFWDDATRFLEEFDIEDVVEITELRIRSSDYGKDLNFLNYSTIKKIQDNELEKITVKIGEDVSKLSEIADGMQRLNITGQITMINEIRSFDKDGEKIHVGNLIIRDSSQSTRVTFWREQTLLFEQFQVGDIIKLSNVSAKLSDYSGEIELQVNNYSKVDVITDQVDDLSKYQRTAEFTNLSEVTETRRGVSIKVQIVRTFGMREVTLKDGTVTNVYNAEVQDSLGNMGRIAAWEDNILKISDFEQGAALVLSDVRIKPGEGTYQPEILIGETSAVEETEIDEIMPMIQSAASYQKNPMVFQKSTLENLTSGSRVETQGTIVKAFKPSFYLSCTKCNRKMETKEGEDDWGTCPDHGEGDTQLKMILSMVLDDTTNTATIKLFDKVAEEFLGITAVEAQDMIKRLSDENAPIKQQGVEMKEVKVRGRVIHDDYSNTEQINVDSISHVDFSSEADKIMDKYDF